MPDPTTEALAGDPEGAPRIAVVMGSASDWPTMRRAAETLERVRRGARVARSSAPTACPTRCSPSPRAPRDRGLRAIIAGAGGAAHLPGMLAAKTTVPVLGVPVPSKHLGGQDSLLLDRADAGRRAGRHVRDRRGRRDERRPVRRRPARRPTTRPSRAALERYRARRRAEAAQARLEPGAAALSADRPAGGDRHARRRPARPLRAASRPARRATARWCSTPTAYAPAGAVADVHLVAAVRRPVAPSTRSPPSARW